MDATGRAEDAEAMTLSAWSRRDQLAVAIGLVIPLLVALLLVPLRTTVPNTDAALVLVAVIVAVAANGHRLAGIVASVSAAGWFDFLLAPPYLRFTITDRDDIETTVLLLLVGAAVTEIAVRGRRQRVLAVTDEAYLTAIADTTELVGSQSSMADVTRLVQTQLTSLLGLRECRFERNKLGGLPRLEPDGRLRWGDKDWDLDQYGMPQSTVELLATAQGRAYGRFVLDPRAGSVAPLAARRVAAILAQHVGAAFATQARVTV